VSFLGQSVTEQSGINKKSNSLSSDKIILVRDPDVLDTWFSSALWPFATLGYNIDSDTQNNLVKQFYPASVLETGHDIIFFWVIRMLLF
jgi:valyl-tRNA synthetase